MKFNFGNFGGFQSDPDSGEYSWTPPNRQQKAKKPRKSLSKGKALIISLLITVVFGFLYFYFSLPALNIHSGEPLRLHHTSVPGLVRFAAHPGRFPREHHERIRNYRPETGRSTVLYNLPVRPRGAGGLSRRLDSFSRQRLLRSSLPIEQGDFTRGCCRDKF